MATDFTAIRKWYSGKALKVLDEYVIPTLAVAEPQGYWPPGAARKVRAALNKQTVAIKWARANERKDNNHRDGDQGLLDDIMDSRGSRWFEAKLRGGAVLRLMEFGIFEDAPRAVELVRQLRALAIGAAENAALDLAGLWASDFAPVATLVAQLDAGRAKPEYVFATVSPTVYASVGAAMGIDFTTVRCPEIVWRKIEEPHPTTGKMMVMWVGDIVWPSGTRHLMSRYAHGSAAGNQQCEACGHAIRSNNWVPLLADTANGPVSLWVGRDCASTLFGAKIAGDVRIERKP